jgi:hypothetical protein
MKIRLAAMAFAISIVVACATQTTASAQGSQYYFPQVVDGVSGNIIYSSSFSISNPQGASASVTIRFFLTNPPSTTTTSWAIDLRSADRPDLAGRPSGGTKTFTLSSGESVQLFTGGEDILGVGWAKIESSIPIEVAEFFDVRPPGTSVPVISEVGVLPSATSTNFSFFISESTNEPVAGTSVDTGIAIVNPSGSTARVTATLYTRSGNQAGQKSLPSIAPNGHSALFVSEIFSDHDFSADGKFHGLVRLSCNVNIAVVALRQTYGNSSTISSVTVNPDSILDHSVLYDREPNDTRTSAQPIGLLPAEIIGTINSPTDDPDTDVYSVNLHAGTVLYVFLTANFLGSSLDSVIQITNPSGVSTIANNFSPGLNDQFLRYQVAADGTYFLSVSSAGGIGSRDFYYRLHVLAQ